MALWYQTAIIYVTSVIYSHTFGSIWSGFNCSIKNNNNLWKLLPDILNIIIPILLLS